MLKKLSTKEQWSNQKEKIKKKIDEKVKEKSLSMKLKKIVQIDTDYESIFIKIRKITKNKLDEYEETGKYHSSDLVNLDNTAILCHEGEKVAHGESLEDNTQSGWNALTKAFKKPSNEKTEED